MSTTSSTITAAGFVGDITGNVTGLLNSASIVKISETETYDNFTDGGAAAGTWALATQVPAGAWVICCLATAVTGFAGDTSAVVTVGDGTDADRYNTGTPDVFSTAASGVALGAPSGVQYHDTAKTVTVTVTSATDFTSVSAGSLTIEIYYLT